MKCLSVALANGSAGGESTLVSDVRHTLSGGMSATWCPDGKIVRAFSFDILRRRMKTLPDLLRVWILGRKRWKPG